MMVRDIERSYLDKTYDESKFWTAIPLTTTKTNYELEMKYLNKKQELRTQSRTEEEVCDRTLFACCDKYEDVELVSERGLCCRMKFLNSCLGNATKGVSLGKHADVFLRKCYNDGVDSCWLITFKAMYGRVKGVLPIQTPPYREPALDSDCHCSFISPSVDDPLHLQEIKSQVYMFERNPEQLTSFNERPRQCVPVSIVMYNRVGCSSDVVDLRLAAGSKQRCYAAPPQPSPPTPTCSRSAVSIDVGRAGLRHVVVNRSEKSVVVTASERQQNSTSVVATARTVLSSMTGAITKITINNTRKTSDRSYSMSQSSSPVAMSSSLSNSSSSPAETPTLSSTAASTRTQYRHLIRRRKNTQNTSTSDVESRSLRDPSSLIDHGLVPAARTASPPTDLDTPQTLLQRQQTLVSDITRQLSVELTCVTSFLRATRPAQIDDRERTAMQLMQGISASFRGLSDVCVQYRRFHQNVCCGAVESSALLDVEALRVHDSTLRRCREKLVASFCERRDGILQTPIASEQRKFSFFWLQRHASSITDCINIVVDVLEAVLPQLPSVNHVPPSSAGTPEPSSSDDPQLDSAIVDIKPNLLRIGEDVDLAGPPPHHDSPTADSFDSFNDARPPSLTPALKTDVVGDRDEPPVLQPCDSLPVNEASNRLLSQPSPDRGRQSVDDRRTSSFAIPLSPRLNPVDVVATQSLQNIKQEPQDVQDVPLDAFASSNCEMEISLQSNDSCVSGDDAESRKDNVSPRENDVRERQQIQRLLDARDQKAFSRLLIDSVCSMPAVDFQRVREMLISKLVDDRHRTKAQMTVKSPGDAGRKTQTKQEVVDELTSMHDENSCGLSLKIVNVRSCSEDKTSESWSCDVKSSSEWTAGDEMKQQRLDSSSSCRDGGFTDSVRVNDDNIQVTTTNCVTIAPIETTRDDVNNDDNVITTCRSNEVEHQLIDSTTEPASIVSRRQPGVNETEVQRRSTSGVNVDNVDRDQLQDVETRRVSSADAESTPAVVASARNSSTRRKSKSASRCGRRPALPPRYVTNDTSSRHERTYPPRRTLSPASSFRAPWLYFRPMALSNDNRSAALHDASMSDRNRHADDPVWMCEMTPQRCHGSVSLHRWVAIASRYLHKAGARHYAARFNRDSDRPRLPLDGKDKWTKRPGSAEDATDQSTTVTVSPWHSGHDDATLRQSTPAAHDAHDGDRRSNASCNTSRSLTVMNARRAGSRSDSESDSARPPHVRDLRYQPIYPARVMPRPTRGTPYILEHRPVTRDRDGRRPRRYTGDRRTTNNRSSVDRKSDRNKIHRYSVSSERSSTSSASSVKSKRSSNNRKSCHFKRDNVTAKTSREEKSDNTVTDDELRAKTDEAHTSLDVGSEADDSLTVDKDDGLNRDVADVQRSLFSHSEPTVFNCETSKIENNTPADLYNTNVCSYETGLINSLSGANCRSTSATSDHGEANGTDEVEQQRSALYSNDSDNQNKPNIEAAQGSSLDQLSPTDVNKRQHSRLILNSVNKVTYPETVKSESGHFERHEYGNGSTVGHLEKQEHYRSRKRSLSHSKDRIRHKSSSKHDDHHDNRTSSRWSKHNKHEKDRSKRRRRSHSSSRERNSSSSSGNHRHSSGRQYRQRDSSSDEDQLSIEHRWTTERKRLEKVRRETERALRKLEQLQKNLQETEPHRKKIRSKTKPKLSTTLETKTTTADLQDKLFVVNSCIGVPPGKLQSGASLNGKDVDFIASCTSPVSSDSESRDHDACNDSVPIIQTNLQEKTSNNEECDEIYNQRIHFARNSELDSVTGNNSGQEAFLLPSSSTVCLSSCINY